MSFLFISQHRGRRAGWPAQLPARCGPTCPSAGRAAARLPHPGAPGLSAPEWGQAPKGTGLVGSTGSVLAAGVLPSPLPPHPPMPAWHISYKCPVPGALLSAHGHLGLSIARGPTAHREDARWSADTGVPHLPAPRPPCPGPPMEAQDPPFARPVSQQVPVGWPPEHIPPATAPAWPRPPRSPPGWRPPQLGGPRPRPSGQGACEGGHPCRGFPAAPLSTGTKSDPSPGTPASGPRRGEGLVLLAAAHPVGGPRQPPAGAHRAVGALQVPPPRGPADVHCRQDSTGPQSQERRGAGTAQRVGRPTAHSLANTCYCPSHPFSHSEDFAVAVA